MLGGLLDETWLRGCFFRVASQTLQFAKKSLFTIILLSLFFVALRLLFFLLLLFLFLNLLLFGFLLGVFCANLLCIFFPLFFVFLHLCLDCALSDRLTKMLKSFVGTLETSLVFCAAATLLLVRLLFIRFIRFLLLLANDIINGTFNLSFLLDEFIISGGSAEDLPIVALPLLLLLRQLLIDKLVHFLLVSLLRCLLGFLFLELLLFLPFFLFLLFSFLPFRLFFLVFFKLNEGL